MRSVDKISAVILAGGSGSRFHGKKQFELLDGLAMWEHPYKKICSILDPSRVTVVGVDIPGGSTRTHSVMNGIQNIPEDTERVLIIEAARPMVTKEQLETLVYDENPSTTFVRPLVNTVIYRNATYINRNELYELLTPQAFDYKLLKEAIMSGKFDDVTDDTRIMFEYHGIKPTFIETVESLMKVTYPEDIHIISNMIAKRREAMNEASTHNRR